ncbi:diguanylate phosphodiesterase [Catellatospora sp. TT07R-123]|uniref:EAL domain-containing protein n=1 Tax=Catellatospora sp. TT07R-123 TaxID=2733863 RepID=UPI001B045178|nr:EAL domain-containing protein [Catellatospora sp. TT07R-123]GHJ43934.1 diguanylate phosphodiesterase [Catellatospora sp. TT07R-123]
MVDTEDAEPMRAAFDALLANEEIRPLFQPIVELRSGAVVAYEALARGPAGSIFHLPAALFQYAVAAGRLAELDWVCRAAACRAAVGRLPRELPLFVNVEPATLSMPPPPSVVEHVTAAMRDLQVVFEMTERALSGGEAELVAAVDWIRRRGGRVALDDVGVHSESLAVMALTSPDIVKLDRGVIHATDSPQAASVIAEVRAHTDRTGAAVLAEGIETATHLAHAVQLGATLGQGWLFGRPQPLPEKFAETEYTLPRITWAAQMHEVREPLNGR